MAASPRSSEKGNRDRDCGREKRQGENATSPYRDLRHWKQNMGGRWRAQAEAALSRISFLLQGFASTPEANYRFQLRPPPPTAAFHSHPPAAAGLVDLAGASAVSSIFPRLAATFPRPAATQREEDRQRDTQHRVPRQTADVTIQAFPDFDFLFKRLQDGLLDAGSSSLGLSHQETTTTLDSHDYTTSSSASSPPSESPSGPLNASSDLSRANPAFSSSITIPQFDFTSFTTDNQRPSWLSQPQSRQPLATNNRPQQPQYSYNSLPASLQQDFQLFPTPQPLAAQPSSWSAPRALVWFRRQSIQIPLDLPLAIADAPPLTVSPQELLLDSSCPPSTCMTDLSTPSFESPGTFSHDTSPLFSTADDLSADHDGWESLFPGDPLTTLDETPKLSAPILAQPPAQRTVQQEKISTTTSSSPATKSRSFPTPSPRTNSRSSSTRPSSVSGVTKRTREKHPLPPIEVDPSDPVAVKRAKNTEAARKSRQRKVELQESLERRIEELEAELEQAKQEAEHWKGVAGHTGN
ncbi:cross-pathway control protein A [Trichophyton equinum CBS 127.97]|uniref:Cross-pathway control protein A n=1 Tax=Trichophyton equinum (strain ATCC MYA-4606 / CBS 127.97) TaxID=559882 RepID=F2Q340_TRIEC|nr:cross-pathway control protein A [Trichophyton equinum CBS 127.97]